MIYIQVNLKALPPMIVNRVMRRHPKAIYRIRKILMSSAGKLRSLSVGTRERSPCSDESLTASEKKAVLDATTEYYHNSCHQDEVSIGEFVGEGDGMDRVHSVIPINLNPHTGESTTEGNVPPNNSSSSPSPRSGGSRIKSGKSNDLKASSNPVHSETALHDMYSDTSASGSHLVLHHQTADANAGSHQESNVILEVDINSDPLIEENTGLEGDSQVTFFTPQGSIDGQDNDSHGVGDGHGATDSSDAGHFDTYRDQFETEELHCNGASAECFGIIRDKDFVQGGEGKEEMSEDDELSISLPPLTLASRSVECPALQQVRRSSSAKLLST